jgi:hypothetical protein
MVDDVALSVAPSNNCTLIFSAAPEPVAVALNLMTWFTLFSGSSIDATLTRHVSPCVTSLMCVVRSSGDPIGSSNAAWAVASPEIAHEHETVPIGSAVCKAKASLGRYTRAPISKANMIILFF